jgi:hypothetical protein
LRKHQISTVTFKQKCLKSSVDIRISVPQR